MSKDVNARFGSKTNMFLIRYGEIIKGQNCVDIFRSLKFLGLEIESLISPEISSSMTYQNCGAVVAIERHSFTSLKKKEISAQFLKIAQRIEHYEQEFEQKNFLLPVKKLYCIFCLQLLNRMYLNANIVSGYEGWPRIKILNEMTFLRAEVNRPFVESFDEHYSNICALTEIGLDEVIDFLEK